MKERTNIDQFQLRLPPGMRPRLAEEAARNASTINSEIIRAVRERLDRIDASMAKRKPVAKQKALRTSFATVSEQPPSQGGAHIHQG